MQPLNIFVVHPSDSLTDHLPNGAGWIDYNYLRGLAERGHTLHIATPRVELRGAGTIRACICTSSRARARNGRARARA